MVRHSQRNRAPTKVMVLLAVMILNFGVLVWSANWNWSIGVHADATATSGGNVAVWLWFLGSLAMFVTTFAVLAIIGTRTTRQRPAQ